MSLQDTTSLTPASSVKLAKRTTPKPYPLLTETSLKGCIAGQGQPVVSAAYVITPAFAKHVLDTLNVGNRTMKPRKIAEYVTSMKAGTWGLTGESLKFDWTGMLRDGQNRLQACIEAGTPFVTVVVFNVDPRLFDVMDTGQTRSGGDVFYIDKVPNYGAMSAATRWSLLFEENKVTTRKKYTNAELLEAYRDRYEGLQDSFGIANKVYRARGNPALSLLIALHHLFGLDRDVATANQFYEGLIDASSLPQYDPRRLLSDRLAVLYGPDQRAHDVVVAATVVIAWKLFTKARTKGQRLWTKADRVQLEWTLKDPFPVF